MEHSPERAISGVEMPVTERMELGIRMEIYDILMLAILVVAVIFGAVKGMAWQIASIAALVVSYFVAVQFNEPVAAYITVEPPLNKLAAMLVLYLGTSLAIWIAFGFIKSYIEKMSLKEFDRHAGALLGAITGVLLCVSLTLFAVTMLKDEQRQYVTRSKSGLYITQGINEFQQVFPPAVHEALEPYIQKLNEEMQRQNGMDPNGLTDPNQLLNPEFPQDGQGLPAWNMPSANQYPSLPSSQSPYPQQDPASLQNGYSTTPAGYQGPGF